MAPTLATATAATTGAIPARPGSTTTASATSPAAKYGADLATGVLDQVTFADLLRSGGMDRHIRRMAGAYRARRDRFVEELGVHLPTWLITGTAAGLHLVVHPAGRGRDEAELAALAQDSGLDARPLSWYAVGTDHGPRDGLVVGYGHQHPDALARGVRRFADRIDAS